MKITIHMACYSLSYVHRKLLIMQECIFKLLDLCQTNSNIVMKLKSERIILSFSVCRNICKETV